jgi:hypothetical protein
MREHLVGEAESNEIACPFAPKVIKDRYKTTEDRRGSSITAQRTSVQTFASPVAASVEHAWFEFFLQNDIAFNVSNSSSHKSQC